MKRFLLLIAAMLACVLPLTAQAVTISATNVHDIFGNKLASGQACFLPTDNSGTPMSFKDGGGGQVSAIRKCVSVTNGAFSATLSDTSLTSPANVCYQTTVKDTSNGTTPISTGYECVQPRASNDWCTSGVCNFDTYTPAGMPNVVQVAGLPGPQGPPGLGVDTTSNIGFTGADTFVSFNGVALRNTQADFWGDSITATCFDGCSNRWPDQFSTARGWTEVNHAVSGSDVADQSAVMYGTTVTSGMRNFMLLGQNGGGSSVGTQARKDFMIGQLEAVYAYLLTPNKVNASAAAKTGTGWGASSYYPGGQCTSNAGDTMTFTLDGTDPMVSIHKTTTSTASWTALLDGTTTYGPYDAVDQYTTINGATNSPHLFHVAGLSKAAHTIVFTNVSGGPFCVDWGASNSNQGANSLVVGTPYNTTSNPESVWRDWEAVVRQAAASIAQAGLGISVADTRGACTDQTGNSLCNDHGDGIHPGLVGDGILFSAFAKATQLFADPTLPKSDRTFSYKSRSFKGLGPFQVTDFWAGHDVRDGGGFSAFGQYSVGGISNSAGGNKGGTEINIGGSNYASQSALANVCHYVNALWGTTGNARLYQICGNGNITAGQLIVSVTGNTLELRNATTSQTLIVNHTYTDSSNWENYSLTWDGPSGGARIGTDKLGTGVSRELAIKIGGVSYWHWLTGGLGTYVPDIDGGPDVGSATKRVNNLWIKTAIRTGTASNTDLAGELTLASGTASYTFTGTYTSHPICTANDETAIGAVKVSYTGTTSVTFSASGATDVISYGCHGRN